MENQSTETKTNTSLSVSSYLIIGSIAVLFVIGISFYFFLNSKISKSNLEVKSGAEKKVISKVEVNNSVSIPKKANGVFDSLIINKKKLELVCISEGIEKEKGDVRCHKTENHLLVDGVELKSFSNFVSKSSLEYLFDFRFEQNDGQRFVRILYTPCKDFCGASYTSLLLDTKTLELKNFDLTSIFNDNSFKWDQNGKFSYIPVVKNPNFDEKNIDPKFVYVEYDKKGNPKWANLIKDFKVERIKASFF